MIFNKIARQKQNLLDHCQGI